MTPAVVTVTRPELTPEERERRREEARKALVAFYVALHEKERTRNEDNS